MPQITLTPKTASYGVLANLPTADVSTTCASINPAYYQAMVGNITLTALPGQYMMVKVTLQNAVGAAVRTLRITKADGVTVLIQFAPASQPALPAETTTVYSGRVIIGATSDWANAQLQVSVGAAGDTVVIKANSLVFAYAESCNITDETLFKRNINNIYFLCMQAAQEAVLGKIAAPTAIAFLPVPVNGLITGFKWSANSGNTLYSWDGSSIGIGL